MSLAICCYLPFSGQRIFKTANTKSANNDGRLLVNSEMEMDINLTCDPRKRQIKSGKEKESKLRKALVGNYLIQCFSAVDF